MANAGERHEQLMQQMAALTASLGGLTNLNTLLAQQTQTLEQTQPVDLESGVGQRLIMFRVESIGQLGVKETHTEALILQTYL